jgi:hypothetical protein
MANEQVDELVAQLEDGDEAAQESAARALGKLVGSAGQLALAPLFAAAENGDVTAEVVLGDIAKRASDAREIAPFTERLVAGEPVPSQTLWSLEKIVTKEREDAVGEETPAGEASEISSDVLLALVDRQSVAVWATSVSGFGATAKAVLRTTEDEIPARFHELIRQTLAERGL